MLAPLSLPAIIGMTLHWDSFLYHFPGSIPSFSRSLVTTLRAAEKFDKAHLSSPEISAVLESAKAYYMEGFFLTHGLESALELSQKASKDAKVCVCRLLSTHIHVQTDPFAQ